MIEGGDTPLSLMRGIGPQSAEKLAARGLSRLADLWLWLPREYEDRTRLTPIAMLQPGVAAQVEGRILVTETAFRFRPMLKVALADQSGATLGLRRRFLHATCDTPATLQG